MKTPTKKQLRAFIREALAAHDDWCAQSGEPYDIKNIEELDNLSLEALRLLASIIIALRY